MSLCDHIVLHLVPQWLADLHNALWGQTDLAVKIFRKVTVTREDLVRLEEELNTKIPHRKAKNYKAKNVLELKGRFLESLSEAMPLDPETPSGSTHVIGDKPKGAKRTASIDTLVDEHVKFPRDSEIHFCDLSRLALPNLKLPQYDMSERVLIRKEYGVIDNMLETNVVEGNESSSSAIITGQPGIGKAHYYTHRGTNFLL